MAKLLVHESAGVREFELVDAETHIGRELDNAVRLSDPSISRHHAVIRKTAEGYEVHDNQSSNGVLVNGNRVQSLPLQDGDRVTLGQVQITFVDPKAPATEAITVTNPLGTVRMTPEDMAKMRALQHAATPADMPAAPSTPMPPPVPLPPPAPMAPSAAAAIPPAPMQPPPAEGLPPVPPPPPPVAPIPATPAPSGANPAPAFIQSFLPPIPDDARPTGERGDFVTRLLAHLIDGVAGFALFIPLMVLSFIPFVGCITLPISFLLSLALPVGVAWCWIKFGATPGKKVMKLRVVPEDNPLGRIDVGTAVLRLVGHMINGMLFGLPYLMILGEERKGLQDIISKSIVVKVDR